MTFLFKTMVLSFLKFIIAVLVLSLLHRKLTSFSEKLTENSSLQQTNVICFISIWVTSAVVIYAIYSAIIVLKNAIDLMIMCF